MPATEISIQPEEFSSADAGWLGIVVAGAITLVGFALSVGSALSWLREWRAARRVSGEPPLEGRLGIVVGVVERLEDDAEEGPVVVASVEQKGTYETNKGATVAIQWRAIGPVRTTARAFGLRLDGGALARVEPGAKTTLVDELDHTEELGHLHRKRFARLEPGERAQVRAVAESAAAPGDGYRSAARTLVLRPDEKGRLWVAAHLALTSAAARRALGHAGLALAMLAAAIGARVAADDFLALSSRGAVATAEGRSIAIRSYRHKGRLYVEYTLTAQGLEAAEGLAFAGQISETAARELVAPGSLEGTTATPQPERTVRVSYLPDRPSVHVLGGRPGLSGGAGAALWVLSVGAFVVLLVGRLSLGRPWWRRDSVDEREPYRSA